MSQKCVTISRYFRNSLSLVLYPSRILGLMPYKFYKHAGTDKIEFSKMFALYSVFTALFLSFAVTGGIIADILHEDTTRLDNPLDKYVAVVEIGTLFVCLWTICICFIVERSSVLLLAHYCTQVNY